MTQLYKSHLFRRYQSIQRIHRRRGIVDDNGFRTCRRDSLEDSSRSFATLFRSSNRKSPLDARIRISKRPICNRQSNSFLRYFSDLNNLPDDVGKEAIDHGYALPPSVDLSQDDNIVSGDSDPFTLFLDTFPRTIDRNVNNIIQKVDNIHPDDATRTSEQAGDDLGEMQERTNGRSGNFRTKSSLRKRWQRLLQNETERYRRTNRVRSKKTHFDAAKPSIEAQWDQALKRKGYCITRMTSEEEQNSGSALNTSELDNNLSDMDESSDDTIVSPIFGLPLNHQQSFLDFETALEENNDRTSQLEVQRIILDDVTNSNEIEQDRSKMHNNAILKSISLLIAMRQEDWRKYDSSVHLSTEIQTSGNKVDYMDESNTKHEKLDDAPIPYDIYEGQNKTREFLQHVMEHKYVLTTSVLNLFLAHLLTSSEIDNQEIADSCLQIYEEMKMLGMSGQHDCRPDTTTYRLLILAFSRRFQAIGEALRISQEMVENSSIDISPGLFNEALKVCRAKTEVNVARMMMDSALRNNRIRISAASCILYTEMLKTGKLDKEAVDLFNRIQKAKLLTQRDEDEYLTCLCRWPQRSRRGDVIDLSSFWNHIRDILEERTMSGRIPHIKVWQTFLQGLYDSAKNDESLWQVAAEGTRIVLDAYPRHSLGSKLMTIGLDASSRIEDAQLMSLILRRLANEPSISTDNSSLTENNTERSDRPAKIPFRALKNSLLIALKASDAKSAQSILESMNQIEDPYPTGAKYELYSLVLKCHAKVNDAENAKGFLQMMVENNMKPSEELYSDVLRTMATAGKYDEMDELFQSMQMGKEDGIEPGVSSYDAVISARIQEQSWDDVFALYDEMKRKEVKPSSHTINGLLIANNEKEGRDSVTSALDSLLLSNAQFDESTFRLASKILFQDVDNNLDDFRKTVREIGEGNQNLRGPSLDLVRSIRFAEVESSRPPKPTNGPEHQDAQHVGEEAWRQALSNLLVFSQALLEAK